MTISVTELFNLLLQQYPEGHLEAQEAKEAEKKSAAAAAAAAGGGSTKRKRSVTELLLLQEAANGQKDHPSSKKAKIDGYQLEPEIAVLIDEDRLNVKLWAQCKEALGETKQVHFQYQFFLLNYCFIMGFCAYRKFRNL